MMMPDKVRENRRIAIKAVYDAGYITKEEADNLVSELFTQRNECTIIRLIDFIEKVEFVCHERQLKENSEQVRFEKLFDIFYIRSSGEIIENPESGDYI